LLEEIASDSRLTCRSLKHPSRVNAAF